MSDELHWLTTREAADRACCRPAAIQRAVRSRRLRSARAESRRGLKFLEAWIDEWLMDQLLPQEEELGVAIDVASPGLQEFR